jgi:hypothetical protein
MPPQIARLPRDRRGLPVPWFAAWQDDQPIFTHADPRKWVSAVRHGKCWICGEPLGRNVAFVLGPISAINRITSEPAQHLGCAIYSVRACPFLINPRMRRVPAPAGELAPGGIPIDDNPGCSVVWQTRERGVIAADDPDRPSFGYLVRVGPPAAVTWWTRGREATAREAADAFVTGARYLLDLAAMEGPDALTELRGAVAIARRLLPEESLAAGVFA